MVLLPWVFWFLFGYGDWNYCRYSGESGSFRLVKKLCEGMTGRTNLGSGLFSNAIGTEEATFSPSIDFCDDTQLR